MFDNMIYEHQLQSITKQARSDYVHLGRGTRCRLFKSRTNNETSCILFDMVMNFVALLSTDIIIIT